MSGPPWILPAAAASGALAIGGRLAGVDALVWAFKPLTTILIVLLAWRRARGAPADAPTRAVLAGLLLSLAGDVLLIPQGLFVGGLLAFLAAHVAYLVAFTRDTPLFARRAPVLGVGAVALAVLGLLWPRLPPGLGPPVLAYVTMLAAMTAQTCVRALVRRDALARRAAIGGVLFMVSDALLAFDRFHTPIPLAALWVLGTYWPAQALIAMSLPADGSSRTACSARPEQRSRR